MSYSFSAKIKVFNNPIEIHPNPEFPTRLESASGFQITKQQVKDNFPIPKGLNLDKAPDEIDVSKVIVDVKTGEFQIGIDVDFGDDFFLNKFPKIVDIVSVHAFVSCNTKPKS